MESIPKWRIPQECFFSTQKREKTMIENIKDYVYKLYDARNGY